MVNLLPKHTAQKKIAGEGALHISSVLSFELIFVEQHECRSIPG